MKKALLVLSILSGCGPSMRELEEIYAKEHEISTSFIEVFTVKGHEYIRDTRGGGITHSESCICKSTK